MTRQWVGNGKIGHTYNFFCPFALLSQQQWISDACAAYRRWHSVAFGTLPNYAQNLNISTLVRSVDLVFVVAENEGMWWEAYHLFLALLVRLSAEAKDIEKAISKNDERKDCL